jgi:hypothetical protein
MLSTALAYGHKSGATFELDRVGRMTGRITRPKRDRALAWVTVNDLVAVYLRFDGRLASGVIWLI